MRMSSLVASVLRPQIPLIDERAARWREIHGRLAALLAQVEHIEVPERPQQEGFVPSSLQFTLNGLDEDRMRRFVEEAIARGVHVKWFGEREPVGFTSRHDHWRYLGEAGAVPNADHVLARLCDIRLPLWLDEADCRCIADVLARAMAAAGAP